MARKATERGVTGDALSDALAAELVVAADRVRLRLSILRFGEFPPEMHLLLWDEGAPSLVPTPVLAAGTLTGAAIVTALPELPGFEPGSKVGIEGDFRPARSY